MNSIVFKIYSVFVLFLLSGFLLGCKNKEGIQPIVGAITESVYGSGNVKAEEQYNVVSSIPGILLKTHVKVGDPVRKDAPIFTIKNPVAEFTIENSQLALRRTEENLKNIKELERQVDLVRNKFRQDSLMFDRQKKLWEQNVGTKVQLEQTELIMKSSKTEYSNRITQLEQARTALSLDYETARNNVRIARENADGYIIRSETEGKIYTINPEEGEGITPQSILAVIGKQDKFLIEIQVDENDIARVRLGQEIFVTMDSYKDSVFKATVSKIYPIMNTNTGTFTVEGVLTKSPKTLYPHLNLEANILIGRKENVLIIPREYLVDDTFVVLESGEKIKVKIGLKNFEHAEILSGLNKDQKIVKP
jgi:HlyD family secretion protein